MEVLDWAAGITAAVMVVSWACGKAYDGLLHRAEKHASDDTSWADEEASWRL